MCCHIVICHHIVVICHHIVVMCRYIVVIMCHHVVIDCASNFFCISFVIVLFGKTFVVIVDVVVVVGLFHVVFRINNHMQQFLCVFQGS